MIFRIFDPPSGREGDGSMGSCNSSLRYFA